MGNSEQDRLEIETARKMNKPTYNELLIELVATLDALAENARTPWVRESARERRKLLIKLPGIEEKQYSKFINSKHETTS